MDIVSYLLELIETQKNVGINGLGTLYKKKTPGRYDSATHSFLPPKYEIAFTSEVKEYQHLIHYISEKRNISIESANYYLTEFVENIHAQLADHQQADFSPLGQLKRVNDEIVLDFSPNIQIGFASFGLPSVNSKQEQLPSNDEDVTTPAAETPELHQTIEQDDQPVFDEIADVHTIQEQNEIEERIDLDQESEPTSIPTILDPLWKPTVINPDEYEEEDEDETKSSWFTFTLKAIATVLVILAIIGAILFFAYPNLYHAVKEKFANPAAHVENEPIVMADTNPIHKIDSPKYDSTNNIPVANKEKDTIATPKPVNKVVTYEVIGGAMKTQKKVDQVIGNLVRRGIMAKKMESMPGRLIKISLGTFTDYNLAKKFQDSLKIKLKNPEIYIQTIKPKN